MGNHEHPTKGHSKATHNHGAHCHTDEAVASSDKSYDNVPYGFSGTVYTCPMHAQVRHVENDGCPICGMALEPEQISLSNEEDTSELDSMTRRFWVSALLSFPLFIYAMGDLLPGRPFEG